MPGKLADLVCKIKHVFFFWQENCKLSRFYLPFGLLFFVHCVSALGMDQASVNLPFGRNTCPTIKSKTLASVRRLLKDSTHS